MDTRTQLTARIEPFDSFWEAPDDIEKGYVRFGKFYRWNYLGRLPVRKDARILVISCGPGYFVNLLREEGYSDVLGIDSFPEKVAWAERRELNCRTEKAYDFLQRNTDRYDAIFCEQELNHLTKEEIYLFLDLFRRNLEPGGVLVVHGLNGANPITGAEALAQNIDHYNSFTEYTMRQVLGHAGFVDVEVFPLNLYVFFGNPLNYVLMAISALYTLFFRFSFMLYGKKNRIFTKKIGAVCRNGPPPGSQPR